MQYPEHRSQTHPFPADLTAIATWSDNSFLMYRDLALRRALARQGWEHYTGEGASDV
jgi:hypothetical protein